MNAVSRLLCTVGLVALLMRALLLPMLLMETAPGAVASCACHTCLQLPGAPLVGPAGPATRGPGNSGTDEPRGINGMASQNGSAHSGDNEGKGHKAPSKGASQRNGEDFAEEQQLDGSKRDLSAKNSKKSKWVPQPIARRTLPALLLQPRWNAKSDCVVVTMPFHAVGAVSEADLLVLPCAVSLRSYCPWLCPHRTA